MTGLTAILARFIHERRLDDLPGAAIDKAKKVIADTYAVIRCRPPRDCLPARTHRRA